ncbi:MAG: glycosyl hydrolase [Clostridia bacterium]
MWKAMLAPIAAIGLLTMIAPMVSGAAGDGNVADHTSADVSTGNGAVNKGIAASVAAANGATADGTTVKIGRGSYTTALPTGQYGPPVEVFKTENLQGAVPTNKWWSSVLWTKYSHAMYPHPLTAKCTPTGLELGYPNKTIEYELDGDIDVLMEHRADLEIQGEGFEPVDARADRYSDWAVDIKMADGDRSIVVTLAHGSPFAFFIFNGVKPAVSFSSTPEVWYGAADKQYLGVTVNGNAYGLFAPKGSTWSGLGSRTITCDLGGGADYFSVAVLPDSTEETLTYYAEHAYAFLTDTRVSWTYDQVRSEVTTTFTVSTTTKEGDNTHTLVALYPHQWRNNASLRLLPMTYRSIRGTMKVIEGNSFTTRYTFNGVLPWLPDCGDYDHERLAGYVREVADEREHIRLGLGSARYNTYVIGKNLGRLANILPIAEQIGDTAARNSFLSTMTQTLEDWFTASPGETENLFYYDKNWGTLIGYNAGYGSNTDLNDHHFHYGYYVFAAAAVALRDRHWADESQWGGMVTELIRDMANWDRSDPKYPFLRAFDPYAGHSWASGSARYSSGNNQESSSEAINAWVSLILWGETTGNRAIRDLGVYLYATETTAVKNYWFNIYGDNFPPEFKNVDCSIVWGGKIVHTTWWTDNPAEVNGINFLPITGGSLYLGHDPEYVLRNYNEILSLGRVNTWHDIIYSYLALSDPETALSLWKDTLTPEFSETLAHTYHWLCNLRVLGRVDTSITADSPLHAVFDNNGKKTYVAYNPTDTTQVVTFSDGTTLTMAGHSMATRTQ